MGSPTRAHLARAPAPMPPVSSIPRCSHPYHGIARQRRGSHRHCGQELRWEPRKGLRKCSTAQSRRVREYLTLRVTAGVFLTSVTGGRNTAGLSAVKQLVLKWKNRDFSVCFLFFSHKEPKKLPVVHTSQLSELVVTYFFCGEEIPYRRMLKAQSLTLGHFKEQLSKKGNYR